jgi:hypothetical protein
MKKEEFVNFNETKGSLKKRKKAYRIVKFCLIVLSVILIAMTITLFMMSNNYSETLLWIFTIVTAIATSFLVLMTIIVLLKSGKGFAYMANTVPMVTIELGIISLTKISIISSIISGVIFIYKRNIIDKILNLDYYERIMIYFLITTIIIAILISFFIYIQISNVKYHKQIFRELESEDSKNDTNIIIDSDVNLNQTQQQQKPPPVKVAIINAQSKALRDIFSNELQPPPNEIPIPISNQTQGQNQTQSGKKESDIKILHIK